jgi:hypothetical protein
MDHIHNETVLAFLKAHREHPKVRRLLADEDREVAKMNRELGTDYKDYLDYLEANSGDDAAYTMEELRHLAEEVEGPLDRDTGPAARGGFHGLESGRERPFVGGGKKWDEVPDAVDDGDDPELG